MKQTINYRNMALDSSCLLYLLTFVYFACTTLVDFHGFQYQLDQYSTYQKWILCILPLLEISLALLLVVEKTNYYGLAGSISLILLFSFNTYTIYQCNSIIPCISGGIWDQDSWKQLLILNIVLTSVALIRLFKNK